VPCGLFDQRGKDVGLAKGKLDARVRAFVLRQPVARLATADGAGEPHVVPVCFTLAEETVYITIDQKPKRAGTLKRLRNIGENPTVALVVDHYEADWSRLGWVMLRGDAEILSAGDEHDRAQTLLRARYDQLRAMTLSDLPVIAIRIARVTHWGALGNG